MRTPDPNPGDAPSVAAAANKQVTTETVRGWVAELRRLRAVDDADLVEQLRVLEELKNAAASAQAVDTVELVTARRAQRQAEGARPRRLDDGIASEVGLARRESPHHAVQHVGLAFALLEMPWTAAAFARGEISEWRAAIVARETACLTRADREEVDRRLGTREGGGLAVLGDQAIVAEARRITYALDPETFTRRAAKAEKDRRVTLRPAPDTMCHLSGLLPVREGVAVYAALIKQADALRAQGDARSRGQIMADTLVERVTGQAAAPNVPVEVNLVMSEQALLGDAATPGRETPAHVDGYGPVPAPVAREWLADPETKVWIRRLYTRGGDNALVTMDSKRRAFAGKLRRFITIRDQRCRTPWCDAPIRHVDHPKRHADGGPTHIENSQGLCEACNHAKDAVGWQARASGDGLVADHHAHRASLPKSDAAKSRGNSDPRGYPHGSTSSTATCCSPPDPDVAPCLDPLVGPAQHEPRGHRDRRLTCRRCASAPTSTSTSRSGPSSPVAAGRGAGVRRALELRHSRGAGPSSAHDVRRSGHADADGGRDIASVWGPWSRACTSVTP